MDMYWSSDVVDLDIDSLLTSTLDPTGEKQKHTGKEKHSIHGIMQCAYKYDGMTSSRY
jgi:hypothetical protein